MKRILTVITAIVITLLPLGAFAADTGYTWNTFFEVQNADEASGTFDLVCYYQSEAPYTRSLSIGFTVPLSAADAYSAEFKMTRAEMDEQSYAPVYSDFFTYNRAVFAETVQVEASPRPVAAFSVTPEIQVLKVTGDKLYMMCTYTTAPTAYFYSTGYPLGTEPVEAFRVSMKGDGAAALSSIEVDAVNTLSYGGDEGNIGLVPLNLDSAVVTTDPNVYADENGALIFAGASTKPVTEGKIAIKLPGYTLIELPAGVFKDNPNVFGVSITGISESGVSYRAVADGVSGKTVTVE